MKIFDCFKFFNELELLDLRIMVLNDLVDYFVLVEANRTHTGGTKEFIFEQNKDRFSDYLDKIIYVKVEDLPYTRTDIWKAENFQRNCITRGLTAAKPTDKIIISDADEIPNPDVIMQNIDAPSLVTMTQKLFYYHVNCLQNQPWWGSVLSNCDWDEWGSPQNLRNKARIGENAVPNGGWHYSFMGGAENIRVKVENIAESHLIINEVGAVADIEKKIKTQKDLWNRTDYDSQKQIVDISTGNLAPKCIKEFIEKYPDFFFKS